MENICRFIPNSGENSEINIINFVYETKKFSSDIPQNSSVYRTALVTSGKGLLKTRKKEYSLSEGDIFFILPSVPFNIVSCENFEYIYISYLGLRANKLIDTLKINSENCVFRDMCEIIPLWNEAIKSDASDLKCEALLLFAFSRIEERVQNKSHNSNHADITVKIKKYVDENFRLPSLNLKALSDELLYSEKYISAAFKKQFKIGFSDYLTTLRIQYACALMEQGLSSISDISLLCGYTDSLYFSKLFKKKMGTSPKKHIESIKSKKTISNG